MIFLDKMLQWWRCTVKLDVDESLLSILSVIVLTPEQRYHYTFQHYQLYYWRKNICWKQNPSTTEVNCSSSTTVCPISAKNRGFSLGFPFSSDGESWQGEIGHSFLTLVTIVRINNNGTSDGNCERKYVRFGSFDSHGRPVTCWGSIKPPFSFVTYLMCRFISIHKIHKQALKNLPIRKHFRDCRFLLPCRSCPQTSLEFHMHMALALPEPTLHKPTGDGVTS